MKVEIEFERTNNYEYLPQVGDVALVHGNPCIVTNLNKNKTCNLTRIEDGYTAKNILHKELIPFYGTITIKTEKDV